MREMHDALRESVDAHARALHVAGIDPTLGARATDASRRRRTMRGIGAATAAAVAVGGFTAGAVALGGVGQPAIAPAAGSADTCARAPYVPPNPAALGDAPFAFRAYVDLRPDAAHPGVVVVLLDGTCARLEPGADGGYSFTTGDRDVTIIHGGPSEWDTGTATVRNYATDGSGSGDTWDGVTPYADDYAWTVTVPSPAPEGVDVALLSATLAIATTGGGMGYIEAAVPDGAVTDAVVTSATGIVATRLREGDSMPQTEHLEGLESVALRVSGLPGGETFTITALYDPTGPDRAPYVGETPRPSSPSYGVESARPSPGSSADILPGSSPVPTSTPALSPSPAA